MTPLRLSLFVFALAALGLACGGETARENNGGSEAHDETTAAATDAPGQPAQPAKPATPSISDRAHRIIVEHLGVDPEAVTDDKAFVDLYADDLDMVELVMAFKEEFNCEIADDAAETFLTVGDAIKFLEKNGR